MTNRVQLLIPVDHIIQHLISQSHARASVFASALPRHLGLRRRRCTLGNMGLRKSAENLVKLPLKRAIRFASRHTDIPNLGQVIHEIRAMSCCR